MSSPLRAPDIDPREIAQFEQLAHRWWDEQGPFWPLHRLNALRVNYIRAQLCAGLGRDPVGARPLTGLRLLDIGCGGGILSESLCRLGARVVGIDVAPKNIAVSRLHAAWSGLDIDYRLMTVDQLADSGATFDGVLNLEVVEHVESLPEFLAACGRLVRPGGIMIIATINRTLWSWLFAILGAEYVLRWLPRGTHRWHKLVTPGELIRGLGRDFRVRHHTGVGVNPFNRRFYFTRWRAVNYMITFERA